MTIKRRIRTRLQGSKRYVFTRDDFSDLAGYDHVGRVLRELVKDEILLKVGYGLYTKAKRNSITGNLMPACPAGSDAVILEALDRLKVDYTLDDSSTLYLSGQSTQIPAFIKLHISGRFSRRLAISHSQLNLEQVK
jgi:hypothetical protein